MSTLEQQLTNLDGKLAEAQKVAGALVAALRRTRAGAKSGHIPDIEKGLPAIRQRAEEALAVAGELEGAWQFDVSKYMFSGTYLSELKEAAAEIGLQMFEKDGRIYCFPLIVRIDAKDSAVRIGKNLERRIRPRELAGILAATQKRPQRFREQQFLELLYKAYRSLAGTEWRRLERGPGPVIPVVDIHEVLTLLPSADYPVAEFGRDLLLLDRQPDLRARDGARFEFASSTIGKERVGRVTVYDEHGRDRLYIGLRFVRGG